MTPRLDRMIAGDFFPSYMGQEPESYWAAVEAHAAQLKRRGVTHVMVNEAVVSIPWAMDPENSYLRFTTYGHSLDKFVSSSWNVGIYHEPLLERNRQLLLQQATLARKYGFRCAMRCVEMTLMPESFFRRHPSLRGPRVDNPACSTTPVFALCPMVPEIQDHYRQMLRKMLELVPDLDEMHIFTNDSGAGFCYSEHLYSGPNGPVHCHKVPTGKQAQTFARVLVEAGQPLNPAFRVVMTSGLMPREQRDFVEGAPAGVAAAVYGAFAWGGGLEDRWGTMAVGPKVFADPAERRKVREWAQADYAARVEPMTRNGCPVYACYNSDYYSGDDPRPYETHEIICTLLRLGVANIIGGGPGWTPYSANTAIIRRALTHGVEPTEVAVAALAAEWVGPTLAPRLCAAWRLTDHVAREWPMSASGGHALALQPLIRNLPIVPDENLLAPDALNYFMTPVLKDEQRMKSHQGGVWRTLHFPQDLILAYARQYETVVFPEYEQALGIFDELLRTPQLPPAAAACIAEQRATVAEYLHGYRHLYHWLLAALHREADCQAPASVPSLPQIIQMEIDLFDATARAHGKARDDSPRVALMRQHRDDPVRRVDMSEFPQHRHAGTAGWQGAHEVK